MFLKKAILLAVDLPNMNQIYEVKVKLHNKYVARPKHTCDYKTSMLQYSLCHHSLSLMTAAALQWVSYN